MLLILAGVTLSTVFSEKGIFNRAETAGAKYNEAKAREALETVLLADGQYEKNINPDYNQDDFLNELIKSEIQGSRIEGDVAIIGEWAFELDRTVPKIGRALGKADKLVFPTVNATADLATDKKNATINITAKEEKNGINKIEIWLLGEKIKEYTYDNVKTEITVNPPYTATQNGKYTIKVYGDLMASKTVEVTEIVASVKFEPNGNNEWKKEHSTKVTIQETADKVVKAKYQWINSVTEPTDDKFTEEQTFKSGDTITKNEISGTYYLWTMLETQSGEKVKWRSEGFNFDNEGPNITKFTPTKYSETGITLSVTAQDLKSGIVKIEYYIDNVIQDSYTEIMGATTSSITRTVNITGIDTGTHSCVVKIYDAENNVNTKNTSGTTKMYSWEKFSVISTQLYKMSSPTRVRCTVIACSGSQQWLNVAPNYKFNCDSCYFYATGYTQKRTWGNVGSGCVMYPVGSGKCSNVLKIHRGNISSGDHGRCYSWDQDEYTIIKGTISKKKGNSTNIIITNINKNAYPLDGEQSGYWYVYKGVQ